MKKKHLIFIVAGVIIIGLFVAYRMYNMPHRDVQSQKSDYTLTASQLVNEYLTNAQAANDKYLQENGESKIIEVSGVIYAISEDMNKQKIVVLRGDNDKAGVSCTFTSATSQNVLGLNKGQTVTIKGEIHAGAGYDKDLDMYEDVIIEKSDLVKI